MKSLWLKFRIWKFRHGLFESAQCPNCGWWVNFAPGQRPRKAQKEFNLKHWKRCEQ